MDLVQLLLIGLAVSGFLSGSAVAAYFLAYREGRAGRRIAARVLALSCFALALQSGSAALLPAQVGGCWTPPTLALLLTVQGTAAASGLAMSALVLRRITLGRAGGKRS